MFLSKEKYDNIMLQLCRIRTEISTKMSAEKRAGCANTRSARPAQAATSCLSAKKSLKQFAATLALGS